MTEERIQELKRKNKNIVAKFFALSVENADKQKCMITFKANDDKLSSIKTIRDVFIAQVVSNLKRKRFYGCEWKYFSNIEFGKDPYNNPNIHMHIQCFYDDINPIVEAMYYVIHKFKLDGSKCDLSIAENNELSFYYVIKDYISYNFNLEFEVFKQNRYKGKSLYSCSRKEIPNYVIRHLYSKLSKLDGWNYAKDKYTFIIGLLNKGILSIKKINNSFYKGYKRVKNWLYKITSKVESTETHPHKINSESLLPDSRHIEGFVIVLMLIWQLLFCSNYCIEEIKPLKPDISYSIEQISIESPFGILSNLFY